MAVKSSDLSLEEIREIEKQATGMAFELEGKINLVQTNDEGEVLIRDEMPVEACLIILRDELEKITKLALDRHETLQSREE